MVDEDRNYDAVWVFNDLMTDLKTSVDNYKNYEKLAEKNISSLNDENWRSLRRLTYFTIILNLCKLKEAYSFYGREINEMDDDVKAAMKNIVKKVDQTKMLDFRNKYICHVFNKVAGKRRVLSIQEGADMLKVIVGESDEQQKSFRLWIYEESNEHCVVNVIYKIIKFFQSRAKSAQYRYK
ncbi:hypothetical protein ACEWH9_10200 [Vibrio diabolicus]|uniref:hypothetical protein n=1 Tax=Vibrio harveyi group TaxID=717610 RepID=UPI000CD35BAB|nr:MULTISPECIES: hypothetical protein [Vibrio harveyi group]AUW07708.1 hypothetical protein C1N51_29300 [Vibrio campbellii]MCR9944238.1 hypothetical protein [Vibrio owensii]MDW1823279.1 hypothetical protein [Vibrio sp. Vb1018]